MKVAIVAPSPVPYTVGGAEKLWWGMLQELNQRPEIEVELIKLPSPERTFRELIASYRMFSELDLSHFDLVISTKYPAWMTTHPNHVCYLQHRLRGLYDTYHFCNQPLTLECFPEPLNALMSLLRDGDHSPAVLTRLWATLEPLLNDETLSDYFRFPGPLAREIIHFLDKVGLNPSQIKGYAAISRNVAQREDYFPPGINPLVIHHPSDLVTEPSTPTQDLFTISRLDSAKRIELLVRAFMATRGSVNFRIAGTGPDEAALKKLAEADPRIVFLGRISDRQAKREYENALAVPFIPYDEDYGLITVEAMSSGKPVITTEDAGGVLEFVEPGVSGLVCAPDEAALRAAMQHFIDHPEDARSQGQNALSKVSHINWPETLDRLLALAHIKNKPTEYSDIRAKVVVVVDFPVWPAQSGGTSRIFNLYRNVARSHDVTLVTLCRSPELAGRFQIAEHLQEIRICKTDAHLELERDLHRQTGASVNDIAAIQGYTATPELLHRLLEVSRDATLCIASHPYLYDAIRTVYRGPIWYDAHNVEFDMKRDVLANSPPELTDSLLNLVREVEGRCFRDAQITLACSEADIERLTALYGEPTGLSVITPNGVAISDSLFVDLDDRLRRKARLGLRDQHLVLFMGSWHGPNIEAVTAIKGMAADAPELTFLILGSVCSHSVCDEAPANLHTLGVVDDDEKLGWFATVDLALNPTLSGSGTNLKMLDYAAAGIPILTTPFGNRGIHFIDDREACVCELDQFVSSMRAVLSDRDKRANLARHARQSVTQRFDWASIADPVVSAISDLTVSDQARGIKAPVISASNLKC